MVAKGQDLRRNAAFVLLLLIVLAGLSAIRSAMSERLTFQVIFLQMCIFGYGAVAIIQAAAICYANLKSSPPKAPPFGNALAWALAMFGYAIPILAIWYFAQLTVFQSAYQVFLIIFLGGCAFGSLLANLYASMLKDESQVWPREAHVQLYSVIPFLPTVAAGFVLAAHTDGWLRWVCCVVGALAPLISVHFAAEWGHLAGTAHDRVPSGAGGSGGGAGRGSRPSVGFFL